MFFIADPSEYEKAEYILLDPPCSGSGMTNRLNIFGDDSNQNGGDRLLQLASLQSKMLVFALKKFPNAKKLIYSTCSVNVEENEQVILIFNSIKIERYKINVKNLKKMFDSSNFIGHSTCP